MSVTTVTRYKEDYIAAYELRKAVLVPTVRGDTQDNGGSLVFLVAGSNNRSAVTRGPNGDIPPADDSQTQVTLTFTEQHDYKRYTAFDIFKAQGNQIKLMRENSLAVIHRKQDAEIINALEGGTVSGGKKVLAQEQTIRRGAHKTAPTLPEGATEEQVAEYRKALGIPESPEGYNLKFAEELKPTEADNALLQDFLRDAHTQHWTPSEVSKAFGWYQQQMARAREQKATETQQARAQTIVDLRREYGAEKDKNLAIADEFLQQRGLAHLLEATLPNGRPVLYDSATMKQLVAIARDHADEDALYGGGDGGGGASLDDQIADLRMKSALGTITPSEDKKYNELLERRMARDARRRGRAA